MNRNKKPAPMRYIPQFVVQVVKRERRLRPRFVVPRYLKLEEAARGAR